MNCRYWLTQVCASAGSSFDSSRAGKHHLVIAIRQMVAIDGDVVELVVEADGLGLLIGLQ